MKIRPDLRMTLLAAALAATAASAYAAYSSSLIPALTSDTPQAQAQAEAGAPPAPSTEKEMALEANESVVVIEDVEKPAAVPAPIVEKSVPARLPVAEAAQVEDPITVTKPRLTEDQRIHAEVMERLASNPRLTGRIGVESRDSVVHLSGLLATPGQVDLAERDARSIRGVRGVQNEIQSRIGIRRS